MTVSERKSVKQIGKADRAARALKQALLAVAIVIVGIVIALIFVKLRKPPRQMKQEVLLPLVKVQQLHVQDIPMVIRGHGTARPKVEVDIVPEVPGKVVHIHPELKVGGLIPANEEMLKIDPRDYELAVQQAEATVADAQVRLDTEQAEAEVARREWEELHPNTEPTSPLVVREPQIRKAKATFESAKAQLNIAELKLERTKVSLPFDALIISEKVDLGQYVVAGQPIGVAYGIDSVEIEVPLKDEELAWFDVFERGASAKGSDPSARGVAAEVKANFAGAEHSWKGYVTRTAGQVDTMSRMVHVIVEVPKPFDPSDGRPPLLAGTFVEVLIEGNILKNAVAVPRDAIHDGNKVWVVNDGRLHIQPLKIVRADKDFAYALSGVDDKASIIVSSLDVIVEGMKVRTQPNSSSAEPETTGPNLMRPTKER